MAELTAAIEKADENMRRARELGDSEKETWSLQERRGLIAELKRREGWRPENIRKYEAADYGLDLPADASLSMVEDALRQQIAELNGADDLHRVAAREAAIKKLSEIGISAPAKMVDAAFDSNSGSAENDYPGRPVVFHEPEPWPESVDGAPLLDDLAKTLKRFVIFPRYGAEAMALWILHAHAFDVFPVSPILGIVSATKRSGKTLVLDLLWHLIPRGLFTSNITPAALFRLVEKYSPGLLIDEGDTFIQNRDELRGILNASHRKSSAYVIRTVGDDYEPAQFCTWCPKVIAMIGKLPETLEDRSITILMKRKMPKERAEKFSSVRVPPELEVLKRKVARWVLDHGTALEKADPQVPDTLNDRAADNWRPLLAVAELAGGEWPGMGRRISEALDGSLNERSNSAVVQLLSDIRDLFRQCGRARLSSVEICAALVSMEERPWPEWLDGKPISVRQLAKLLAPLQIRPHQLWSSGENVRGYDLADFNDAFARYLPADPLDPLEVSVGARLGVVSHPLHRENLADRELIENRLPEAASNGLTDTNSRCTWWGT